MAHRMAHRFFVPDTRLAAQAELELPARTARHVMVRRLQPGDALVLFDGSGVDWPAEVRQMSRNAVHVRLADAAQPAAAAELPFGVTLAFGMPANERMDALVEKAAELGASVLQPLLTERSVLRLAGERALRRVAHWQGIAQAASEQCGRARVPCVRPVLPLAEWLPAASAESTRQHEAALRPLYYLLSTAREADGLPRAIGACGAIRTSGATGALDANAASPARSFVLLSGPEGGLSATEQQAAARAGFVAVSLGPRILRADTAPLAALAWLSVSTFANA